MYFSANDAESQKRWLCEICPQSFTTVESLNEHEKQHDAEKPYICLICEKDFSLKSSLSRHIQLLHNVDPSPYIDTDKCLKKVLASQLWNQHVLQPEIKQDVPEESSVSPVPADVMKILFLLQFIFTSLIRY